LYYFWISGFCQANLGKFTQKTLKFHGISLKFKAAPLSNKAAPLSNKGAALSGIADWGFSF
jgi:hypothetical protein